MLTEGEMVPYSTATVLAQAYQQYIADTQAAFDSLRYASEKFKGQMSTESHYGSDFNLQVHYRAADYDLSVESQKNIELEMRRAMWALLINKLGIRKVMSAKRQEELDATLNRSWGRCYSRRDENENILPEITEENIVSVLQGFVNSSGDYFTEQVTACYDWLRPGSWQHKYKTNELDRIGDKLIKGYLVRLSYCGQRFEVVYDRRRNLSELDAVFHRLDGKGVPVGHGGPLVDTINVATRANPAGETEYFRFRCFKNQNLHLEFKRKDLLQRFNQIACEGRATVGADR